MDDFDLAPRQTMRMRTTAVTAGFGQPISVERVKDEIAITLEQIQRLDQAGEQSHRDTRVEVGFAFSASSGPPSCATGAAR
jgi:hypothetical protein